MSEQAKESSVELRHWQRRVFWSIWITYFAFYLCRYNMPVAKKVLCETFSWDNADFGMVLTSLLLMYAVGQFVNGQLADRFGTRVIASLGAFGSVVMNLAVFALVCTVEPETTDPRWVLTMFVIFWGINGFLQAMGWSPMVKAMAHWYPVSRRGKMMGLMGTCYQFGGAFSWFLAFFLVNYVVTELGGDWRNVFLIPAILFAAVGVFFYFTIRNRPEDVGLPAVNPDDVPLGDFNQASRPSISANVVRTLKNPYLWIVAGAFFFLDVNRYGFVNWLPAYFDELAGEEASTLIENFKLAMKRCIHPLAGSAGAIFAGWATDRFFGGRRAPVIVVLLAILGVSTIFFTRVDPSNTPLVISVVALIGFCTYGPHILMVGHAAQDFGKKSGAAGAAGFIDGMGYIGAALTGWGAGAVIDTWGYDRAFGLFGFAAILGAVLAALIWQVGPHDETTRTERQ